MKRFYTDFKNKRQGKNIDYDTLYGFQCTDIVKQYLEELGFGRIGTLGNAKDFRKSRFFDGRACLSYTKAKQGDIIVSIQGNYGHVGIVDRIRGDTIYILEQNGSGKNSGDGKGANAIRVHGYNKTFFSYVLKHDVITYHYNNEISFVNDRIKEIKEQLKITEDYLNAIK